MSIPWIGMVRMMLTGLLIYAAVWGESKAAMAIVLALIVLANEAAAMAIYRRPIR